ncbi:MAG: hypothetical protein AWU57_451 [Marinobacter sp. T13-3]|nr:MAG: hypothetical protein AWU57_451 [Marinobacter sp. T13-3]
MSSDLALAVTLSAAIASAAVLRKRIYAADEFRQMGLLDWCGHISLIGIVTILATWPIGWMPLTVAGLFLLLPLYPIAILGVAGVLVETFSDLCSLFRKR